MESSIMSLKRWIFLPAVVALATFGTARADYSYQAAASVNPAGPFTIPPGPLSVAPTGTTGLNVNFFPTGETVSPTSIYGPTYTQVSVTTNNTTPQNFTQNYVLRVTITNISGGGTGTFFIYGTLTGTSVQGDGTNGAGNVANTYNQVSTTQLAAFPAAGGPLSASQTIGNTVFTFTEASPTSDYARATINPAAGSNGNGGFSALITPSSTIPEPASVVMLSLGICGVGLAGLRKHRTRA